MSSNSHATITYTLMSSYDVIVNGYFGMPMDPLDPYDEEDSSDSEEEEEEHLAPIVPTPALHSSIPASMDSDETEPFEEGEAAATPPPFGYRVAARIFVQTHIFMPFCSESKPLPIFTPLPTSSFSLPLSLPSTSGSDSIPEADISFRKRARFTTPTGGYEIGESSVAAAARHIRPTLTIADSRRAEDRLIGRLRRERRYFCTLSTTYAKEVAHSRDYCTQIMDYCQLREKMAPKRVKTTRVNPDPTRTTTATEPMTQEAINNLIAQRVAKALAEYETQRNSVFNGDTSNTMGTGPRTVCPTRGCTYKDYLNYGPLKFNGTEGVIVSQEVAYTMPWRTLKQMMTAKYCPRGEIKKLEVELWNLKESDEIERYVGGLPEMIRGNVMSYEPKSMKKAIEFANDQMDQKLIGIVYRQADKKKKFDNTSRNQQNQQPFRGNNNVAQAYAAGSGEKPYRGTKPLYPKLSHPTKAEPQGVTY
nr:hypothetical protein [Tanacetum cinerariifolium]